MQMQGKPKGLKGLWMLKGQVKPPRHPRLQLVLPAPRLTRDLLRQSPDPHLSKSEVSRLADRGAALGHGTKTADLSRGVRLPNDSLWGRGRTGEIQQSLRAQCFISCACLRLSEHARNRRWYERRGTGDVELSHFQLPVRYDAHGSRPERERAYGKLSSSCMTMLTRREWQVSYRRMNNL